MQPVARKALGAAALILNPAGQFLLVKHSYGMMNWELPGGVAEANESPVETALREVREETGLVVAPERLTGIYYDPSHPLGEFLHFVFQCRLTSRRKPRAIPPEIAACGFWSVELLPRPISNFTVRRIEDGLAAPGSLLPLSVGPRRWLLP